MTLVLVIAQVISLDEHSFGSYDTKIVKFFAPWCGHCKAFSPEYERLSELTSIPVTEVDCDAHKQLCDQNAISGFPTVKFYLDGNVYDYEGPRSAESIIEFTERMRIPPLVYSEMRPEQAIWFEYFTDQIEQDQDLFTPLKGKATLIASHGERRLVAHIDGDVVEYRGELSVQAVTRFVRNYMYGMFPLLTQDIMSTVQSNKIAVYVHNATENTEGFAQLARGFDRSEYFYTHMDGSKYLNFVQYYGCINMPCGLVFDRAKQYSQEISGFSDFLPFVQRVEAGDVEPFANPQTNYSAVWKAVMRVKWAIEDFLEGKSQLAQGVYVGSAIVVLGLFFVVPITICCAKRYLATNEQAEPTQPEANKQNPPKQEQKAEAPAEQAPAPQVVAPERPNVPVEEPQPAPEMKHDAEQLEANVVAEPVVQKATKKGRRMD